MTTDTRLQNEEYKNDEYPALDPSLESDEELYEPYKSMSKAAAISLIAALFSLTGLLFPYLLSAAVLAVVLGLWGLRNVRRYPNELTGRRPAIAGVALGSLLAVGGVMLHTYVYMTEVPEGYQRITFAQLQPPGNAAEATPASLPHELNGKRVFVKGYVHPGVSDMGEIKKFVLVPDMGTCCFGGQPKLTDMIEVTITAPRGIRYAQIKRKLAGVFHVHNRLRKVAGDLQGGLFELEADYVR